MPFGEFIPYHLQTWMNFLGLPSPNLRSYPSSNPGIYVNHQRIASLICYELAYPELLREQLPQAKWIVSISDGGWFGHSFAIYQQLQMAQVLAISAARFHIVANNGGLSAIIDDQGNIQASLPAFEAGLLTSKLYAASGSTPWVRWGDFPCLGLCFSIVAIALLRLCKSCFNVKNLFSRIFNT